MEREVRNSSYSPRNKLKRLKGMIDQRANQGSYEGDVDKAR